MNRTTRSALTLLAAASLALAGCGNETSDGSAGSALTAPPAVALDVVKSDLRTIADEFETFFVDNMRYPAAMTQTGSSVVLAGSSHGGIVVTEGVTYEKGTGPDLDDTRGFCITATAPGLEPLAYDSDAGGMTDRCG